MRSLALLAIAVLGCSERAPRLGKQELALSPTLVISAVYGGSIAGGTYTHDFVELFNRGSAPVVATGMSLQYSRTDYRTWSANVVALSGTIPPGGYYLVKLAGNEMAMMDLPASDATGSTNIATATGLYALVNGTTPLDCGPAPPIVEDGGTTPDPSGAITPCTSSSIVDFVGQGGPGSSPAPAPLYEGSAAAPNGNTTSVVRRKGGGCVETDENDDDFERVAFDTTVVPRNSLTPTHLCTSTTDAGVDAVADTDVDAVDAAEDVPSELDDVPPLPNDSAIVADTTPLSIDGVAAGGGGCSCRVEGPNGPSFSAAWALALALIARVWLGARAAQRRRHQGGGGCVGSTQPSIRTVV